jgi:hypothetical protein
MQTGELFLGASARHGVRGGYGFQHGARHGSGNNQMLSIINENNIKKKN